MEICRRRFLDDSTLESEKTRNYIMDAIKYVIVSQEIRSHDLKILFFSIPQFAERLLVSYQYLTTFNKCVYFTSVLLIISED